MRLKQNVQSTPLKARTKIVPLLVSLIMYGSLDLLTCSKLYDYHYAVEAATLATIRYLVSLACAQRMLNATRAPVLHPVSVSNGPSGGQIMLIAIMLALWRMYR